jgi:hypothetical protein
MDRFWIPGPTSGTGNINDTAHWSDVSGGTGGFSVPIATDNAIWDNNSFTATGQRVTRNTFFSCASMSWDGVTNNPDFYCSSASYPINCYGNFTLSPNMTLTGTYAGYLNMRGTGTLTTAGKTLYSVYMNLANDTDIVDLLDVLTVTTGFTIDQGIFESNDFNITCGYLAMISEYVNKTLSLGTSVLTINSTNTGSYAISILNSATSYITGTYTILITTSSNFKIAVATLSSNISNIEIVNRVVVYIENLRVDVLTIPDSLTSVTGAVGNVTLAFTGGRTYYIEDIIGVGSYVYPIYMYGGSAFFTATLYTSSAIVLESYAINYCEKAGSGSITANNSANMGGNVSIIFTGAAIEYFIKYWVGGTGNINDTNHWARYSGGPGGAPLSNLYDAVRFDSNSFTAGGQQVTINASMTCKSISFIGVTNNPNIYWSSAYVINSYGDITFASTSLMTISGTYKGNMWAYGTGNLTTGGHTLYALNLWGATVNLLDELTITTGFMTGSQTSTFYSNDHNVTCGYLWSDWNSSTQLYRYLNFGTSIVTLTTPSNSTILYMRTRLIITGGFFKITYNGNCTIQDFRANWASIVLDMEIIHPIEVTMPIAFQFSKLTLPNSTTARASIKFASGGTYYIFDIVGSGNTSYPILFTSTGAYTLNGSGNGTNIDVYGYDVKNCTKLLGTLTVHDGINSGGNNANVIFVLSSLGIYYGELPIVAVYKGSTNITHTYKGSNTIF